MNLEEDEDDELTSLLLIHRQSPQLMYQHRQGEASFKLVPEKYFMGNTENKFPEFLRLNNKGQFVFFSIFDYNEIN